MSLCCRLSGHLPLPDCDQLPQHGDGSAHRCSHSGLTVMLTSQVTCEYSAALQMSAEPSRP